jgi:hypothetical protein
MEDPEEAPDESIAVQSAVQKSLGAMEKYEKPLMNDFGRKLAFVCKRCCSAPHLFCFVCIL